MESTHTDFNFVVLSLLHVATFDRNFQEILQLL